MAGRSSHQTAATAASPFFQKLPAEMRTRVYAFYFASYVIDCKKIPQPFPPTATFTYISASKPGATVRVNEKALTYLKASTLSGNGEGQLFMVYSVDGEGGDLYSGEVLSPSPLSPLLCVCRQVRLEASPFIISNAHFSISNPWVLLESLTTLRRRIDHSQWKIPNLMKERGDFSKITSLQVCMPYNENNITDVRSLGEALTTKLPKLQRLMIDLSRSEPVRESSYLPKVWLAEMLFPIKVKQMNIVLSTYWFNNEMRFIAEMYTRVLMRHCQAPADTSPSQTTNSVTDVVDGSDSRLTRDENDGSVLYRAVIDAILREVANCPARVIEKWRLSKAKGQYAAALGRAWGSHMVHNE